LSSPEVRLKKLLSGTGGALSKLFLTGEKDFDGLFIEGISSMAKFKREKTFMFISCSFLTFSIYPSSIALLSSF